MMIHYNFIYFLMLQKLEKKHEKKLEHDGFFPCRSPSVKFSTQDR